MAKNSKLKNNRIKYTFFDKDTKKALARQFLIAANNSFNMFALIIKMKMALKYFKRQQTKRPRCWIGSMNKMWKKMLSTITGSRTGVFQYCSWQSTDILLPSINSEFFTSFFTTFFLFWTNFEPNTKIMMCQSISGRDGVVINISW